MVAPPSLCLGLPVRNGERYLPQAIESLLNQTYRDFEIVVSDNDSTDSTGVICRRYERLDRRVRYTRTTRNIGAGPNFNRVFRFCRSPFFKWMAHDDMLASDALARLMEPLVADPGIVLTHSRLSLVDEAGAALPVSADGLLTDRRGRPFHPLEPPHLAEGGDPARRFAEVLRRMNWCTAIFGIMRADGLRRTHMHGSYYEADRVLLAELALLGRFCQLDEPLMIKRCHEEVSVLKSYEEQARMIDPSVWPGPKGLRLRLGYLRSLGVGRLAPGQRLACAATVVRVSLRSELTRRLARRQDRNSMARAAP